MKAFLVTVVLAFAAAAVAGWPGATEGPDSAEPTPADSRLEIKQGASVYQIYCSNCHGKDGRGSGPTAKILSVSPADLTRIAERNDGEFPVAKVRKVIDGRGEVRGHGQSGMPIWGLALQEWDKDTAQEKDVRARILQLTLYLESIQTGGR